tara:strand:- start:5219 stop:5368 length:150 start_codon:yes stop_codon:yes gene_type:complete
LDKLTEDELIFLLKTIVESKNIHGVDLEKAVRTFDKLQKMLKELKHANN